MSSSSSQWTTDELLVRVAWFYYKDELTQDEIAGRLNLSRASVSRLLERARKVGLVSISLNSRFLDSFELSSRLREAYGLAEALVVPEVPGTDDDTASLNDRLGQGGAQYLATRLPAGCELGVGWGDTISRVVAAGEQTLGSHRILTLTGGVDAYLPAVAHSRGDPTVGAASIIPSPIVASSTELAAALRAEPTIRRVLRAARSLQHAVVGVGTPAADATLVRMGYMSARDARAIKRAGAVGDILGQFFDADGVALDLPLHERRIGVDLADLRRIRTVVGVAGGTAKVPAIIGALRGGYLGVLVTDESTARRLLDDQPG